ncbi:MAG TPA: NADH:flavin oxidoreductase/NADH oxidase [Chitinophagaceae bacterium]|nr:NADH:flavin oxidoreductase/NADH oxidase [Chitinophagaceae bacterium]
MSRLFSPIRLRSLEARNRIMVSPMCEYSSQDGFASDWHLVHLGSRAVGGAGLVFTEATAVCREGRISPDDLGIYLDGHIPMLQRITAFLHNQGAIAGIQLAHAGRKGSHSSPWKGNAQIPLESGGWICPAPSPLPFRENTEPPQALDQEGIDWIRNCFVEAAGRALETGFDVIEIHAAHGYLLHEFLSPLSNQRSDQYGGSLENRMRLVLEVAAAVRQAWPERLPLFVRISATDWADGGWDLEQSITLCNRLREIGADLVDCSSGAILPNIPIPAAPGYQVPFAAAIRKKAGIPTGAVGMITDPFQAEQILEEGKADLIIMARELLRDPYFPLHAAQALGADLPWPKQYERAKPAPSPVRK